MKQLSQHGIVVLFATLIFVFGPSVHSNGAQAQFLDARTHDYQHDYQYDYQREFARTTGAQAQTNSAQTHDYQSELAQIPADQANHMACSASGFEQFGNINAFISRLIFSGIDIEACARHLQMAIVGNFLVLNFEEFDTLLAAAELQQSVATQIPLFSGPFISQPNVTASMSSASTPQYPSPDTADHRHGAGSGLEYLLFPLLFLAH